MDCEQIQLNLLAYLDGELGDAERAEIEAHVATCDACAAELARLQALQADLWDAVPVGLDQLRLPDDAGARIRARLQRARGRSARGGFLAGLEALLRPAPALVKVAIPAFVLLAIVVVGLVGRQPTTVRAQETFVLSPATLVPDTDAALRVIVREAGSAKPISDAELQVDLRPQGSPPVHLYSGRTDDQGTAEVRFRVPDTGQESVPAALVVTSRSSLGEDEIQRDVEIRRSYRLYLSPDKPLYRPGQTLHIRTVGLDGGSGRPLAERSLLFAVHGPAGEEVFERRALTSAYGIAAVDYALAADAPYGTYRLTVAVGDTVSERTVSVGDYERPPFGVEVEVPRSYYLAGEVVEAAASAFTFYEEPLSGAEVVARAYLHDPERTLVATLQGRTDPEGVYRFRFTLPAALETPEAHLALEAVVSETGGGDSWSGLVVPVALEPLAVDVVAEGGRLRPGVENEVHILVSSPDGAPVRAALDVRVGNERYALATGEYGMATLAYTPDPGVREVQVDLVARDEQGQRVAHTALLSAAQGPAQVLLRPDRAAYQVGETIQLEVLAAQGEVVYVDVLHRDQGQTLGTHLAFLDDGRGALALDVSPQMAGTIELHAYQVLPDGTLARDSRLAVVEAPRSVTVDLVADQDSYAPGGRARVALATTLEGVPAQSALGIAVVDESLYALEERAPGFSKLYFLLDRGLDGAPDAEASEAQDRVARAAWADLPQGELAFARSDPSRALRQVQARGQARWHALAWGLGVALLALACGAWIVVLDRGRALGATLWRTALPLTGLTLVVLLPATVLLALLASVILGDLGTLVLLVVVLVAWLAAVLVLGLHFWRRRDDLGQIAILLAVAYGLLVALLGAVAEQGGVPGNVLIGLVLLSSLATWMALLALAAGLWREGRRALSGVAVTLVLLSVVLIVLAGAVWNPSSLLARTASDPRVYAGPLGWLSGCAPPMIEEPLPQPSPVEEKAERTVVVEKEVEKAVKETVADEKAVEVTRVVEAEKEVTLGVAGTPAPRATPTAAAEAVLPTATPQPTGTPQPSGTQAPSLPLRPGQGLPPASPTPLPAEEPVEGAPPAAEAPAPSPTPPLPLLGQVAPETIYWVPEAITDPQGRLVVEIPFPDVPAAWRMTVLASTLNGELGEATTMLPAR
jgi:anti-sigma factor RsiW